MLLLLQSVHNKFCENVTFFILVRPYLFGACMCMSRGVRVLETVSHAQPMQLCNEVLAMSVCAF